MNSDVTVPGANSEHDSNNFYVFTKEEHFMLVNIKCTLKIIPKAFKWCLDCSIPGNVDETIKKFVDSKQTGTQKDKQWYRRYAAAFKNGYQYSDATNLYEIIPYVCPNISHYTKEFHLFDSLEYALRQGKNIRNDVAHNDNNAAASETIVEDISKVTDDIIERAGIRFKVDSSKIEAMRTMFKEEIRNFQECQHSHDEKVEAAIKNNLMKENSEKWMRFVEQSMTTEKLPFSRTEVRCKDVFHDVELGIVDDQSGQSNTEGIHEDIISCTDILSIKINNTNIDIIEGDPGSGKSTIVKQLCLEFCDDTIEVAFKCIRNYSLIMFISCRDSNYINSFWIFFQKFYDDTAKKFCKTKVIAALRRMKLLIVIDGLDECNEESEKLVEDVIQIFENCENIKIVVTARPGFSVPLKTRFDDKGMNYRVYNIKPISGITKQIEFLERYQKEIPGMSTPGLVGMFKKKRDILSSNCVRPLSLALFAHVFNAFPQKVIDMTTDVSLIELTFDMCRENMGRRLAKVIDQDPFVYTELIMETVSRFCLKLLQREILKLEKKQCTKLKVECWKIDRKIPIESCLSCLFQERISAKSSDIVNYTFFHKQQQEYLASTALVGKMEDMCKGTILDLLTELADEQVQMSDMKKYREVLRFSILELSRPEQHRTLKRWKTQLALALSAAVVTESYCMELSTQCFQCLEIWELLSEALRNYIILIKPSSLQLKIPTGVAVPSDYFRLMLHEVQKHHDGKLELHLDHYYYNYIPCDDLITMLNRTECRLTWFCGCVESVEALQTLGSLRPKKETAVVFISLRSTNHSLEYLAGSDYLLRARIKYHNCSSNNLSRPLPHRSILRIEDIPHGGVSNARNIAVALAPTNKKYSDLCLAQCALTDSELHRLLSELHIAGITTDDSSGNNSSSRWNQTLIGDSGRCYACFPRPCDRGAGTRCLQLLLSDDPPAQMIQSLIAELHVTRQGTLLQLLSNLAGAEVEESDLKGYLEVLTFTIVELSQSDQLSTFQHWGARLTQALLTSGISLRRCLTLLDECPQYLEVWDLMVNLLSIFVKIKPSYLMTIKLPDSAAAPDQQLKTLLEQVKLSDVKKFGLRLLHSYYNYQPCDDVITIFNGARYTLDQFYGCVASAEAVQSINALVPRAETPEPSKSELEPSRDKSFFPTFHSAKMSSSATVLPIQSEKLSKPPQLVQLISKADFAPRLFISLRSIDHHLHHLEGANHILHVRVLYHKCSSSPPLQKPLPPGSKDPTLRVEDIPAGGSVNVRNIIVTLSPVDKKYFSLFLTRCRVSDKEVDQLVSELYAAGLRTDTWSNRKSSWHAARPFLDGMCFACTRNPCSSGTVGRCLVLEISNNPPKEMIQSLIATMHVTRQGTLLQVLSTLAGAELEESDLKRYQEVLRLSILELSRPIELSTLKHWKDEMTWALTKADVTVDYCIRMLGECHHSQEVCELLVNVVCNYILKEKLDKLELRIPVKVAPSTKQLELLLEQVQKHHQGQIDLRLYHSYINYIPCDGIAILAGAGCRLTTFYGCVESVIHVLTLATMLPKATKSVSTLLRQRTAQSPPTAPAELYLSLRGTDHQLHHLSKHDHWLFVQIMYDTCGGPPLRHPLPYCRRSPRLRVEDVPAAGGVNTRNIILVLAPKHKRYWSLFLSRCYLTVSELNNLVSELYGAGIRTDTWRRRKSSWCPASTTYGSGCSACHRCLCSIGTGPRCVQLVITNIHPSGYRRFALMRC